MSNERKSEWTVGEVAAMLGISVRTLHYWEERGVVRPSARTGADYRIYSEDDVRLLQQVLVYRATGMSLDDISAILSEVRSDVDVLRHQRELLVTKQADTNAMIRAIDNLLEDSMSEKKLDVNEVAEILGDAKFPEYQEEAAERWGETDDWEISRRNTENMTEEDWAAQKSRQESVESRLAAAMVDGVTPGSAEANELAEEHRALLSEWFPVSHSKHVLISRGYVADPRFREHYDSRAAGLAEWLAETIQENARANGVDPASAEWE